MCSSTESEPFELDGNDVELWDGDEDDELQSGWKLSDSELPTDDELQQLEPVPVEAQALSKWVLLFRMYIRAKKRLSDTVVTLLLKFFCVFLTACSGPI